MRATRFVRANGGLAAVAIGSLALGLGGNVTVYSVAREMILDDLSATHPERLVRTGASLTFRQWRELRQAGVFEDAAFYRGLGTPAWRTGDHSEIAWRIETSPNFFDVLGVRAAMGRLFTTRDDGRAVVASYAFWRRRLGGDPHAVGRPIELNGRLYELAGVLPEDYRSVYGLSVSPELYVQTPLGQPEQASAIVFARLRPGQSREAARGTLSAAASRMWGAETAGRVAVLRPMAGFAAHMVVEGDGFYRFFVALLAVAGMLAFIACANLAGLLLARGLSRQREIAIRKALGAGRWQVMRPQLIEAAWLIGAGAGCGLLLHLALSAQLRGVRFPSAYGVPFEFHFRTDAGLLLYAVGLAVAALAIAAMGALLRGSDAEIGLALKQGEPAFSARQWNARSVFVALQMALAVMLLALGALFTRSFVHVATADLGFDAAHILMAGVQPLPGSAAAGYRERLLRRIEAVPGVVAASSVNVRPLAGEMPKMAVRREGDSSRAREVYVVGAGERYCVTMGSAILRGRDFRAGDSTLRPRPAILNRRLAHELFGDGDPVGQQVRIGRENAELLEVVGVVADARLRSIGEDRAAAVYVPDFGLGLMVRLSGEAERWAAPVRQAMAEVDRTAALDVRPMGDAVAGGMFPMRIAAALGGSLSVAGLLLAMVGLYAAVAHAVGRRTREMGIRAALGATRARIVWTAMSGGMTVLAIGAAVGLAVAMALIRPLVGIVPDGVNPWDARQFASVAALLLATGAAAAAAPARRAARVDAAMALRQD